MPACEHVGADASTSPEQADTLEDDAEPAPPADAFEITMINRCAEKWRFYVAPAAAGGDSGEASPTAAESVVVPDDQYTLMQPGASLKQTLGPGDVIWLVNRKGESTATGFASKAEGEGGRVEINPDCETIKRVRMAPAGA